jgi:hypothetical protein
LGHPRWFVQIPLLQLFADTNADAATQCYTKPDPNPNSNSYIYTSTNSHTNANAYTDSYT